MTNHETSRLGWQRLSEGRNDEARRLFEQVLAADPHYAAALHGAGYLAWIEGRPKNAIDLLLRALRGDPKRADAHLHLAACYRDAGQLEPAIASARRAVQLDPKNPNHHAALASTLSEMQRHAEALTSYHKALELDPANLHILLGTSLVLRALSQGSEAEAIARRAVQIDPSSASARLELAYALEVQNRLDEAEEHVRATLRLTPEDPDVHMSLAMVLLCKGDLPQGLAEYEYRFAAKIDHASRPDLASPRWHGDNAPGKTLLIQWEQGFGDTLQFLRFIPQAASRVGRIIIREQAAMLELLRASLPQEIEVVSNREPAPAHDLHIPLMSLPLALGTTLETIPAEVPYVRVPPERAQRWAARLPPAENGLRVGLAWAGEARHRNDAMRSIDPAQLAPLAGVEGITWVSLQKPRRGNPPLNLLDLTSELADFADTAALVEQLHLVISVDTAMAHLAGALARPTWTLLPFAPEWRWLNDRTDSPWYPTMRLFRQPAVRDWASVMTQLVHGLRELTPRP